MISLRSLVFHLLLASLIIVPPQIARAQEQQPEEEPAAEGAAAVRVWLFPGSEKESVEVAFSTGEEAEKKVMARAAGGESRSEEGYQAVAAAQLLSETRVGGRVVSSTPVNFRKGSSYTMVVWSSGGKWEAKLFSDTSTPQKSERHVRVVNFADERQALLRIDGAKPSRVTSSSAAEFPAPAGIAMVKVEVVDPKGGPPALSSVEIDFAAYLNSYVVIAPDYRGRMRPRVIGGGRTRESLAAEAAASAAPPP